MTGALMIGGQGSSHERGCKQNQATKFLEARSHQISPETFDMWLEMTTDDSSWWLVLSGCVGVGVAPTKGLVGRPLFSCSKLQTPRRTQNACMVVCSHIYIWYTCRPREPHLT